MKNCSSHGLPHPSTINDLRKEVRNMASPVTSRLGQARAPKGEDGFAQETGCSRICRSEIDTMHGQGGSIDIELPQQSTPNFGPKRGIAGHRSRTYVRREKGRNSRQAQSLKIYELLGGWLRKLGLSSWPGKAPAGRDVFASCLGDASRAARL